MASPRKRGIRERPGGLYDGRFATDPETWPAGSSPQAGGSFGFTQGPRNLLNVHLIPATNGGNPHGVASTASQTVEWSNGARHRKILPLDQGYTEWYASINLITNLANAKLGFQVASSDSGTFNYLRSGSTTPDTLDLKDIATAGRLRLPDVGSGDGSGNWISLHANAKLAAAYFRIVLVLGATAATVSAPAVGTCDIFFR